MAFSYQVSAQITVGTGTGTQSNVPIVSCYGFTYSQQIYTQTEINSAGDITSIAFYVASLPGTNDQSFDWTITMGHSAKTSFESTTDWEPAANLTQVYSGNVTYPTAGNWMTITLDTPFTYNNTDNLIVAVDENQTGWDCTIQWQKTDTAVARSIYYRNDSTNPDPDTPPTATGTGTYFANAVFGGLTASLPPNCDAVLTTPVDGDMNADLNAGLAWSAATGSATGYKVTIGTTTGGTDVANAVDVGTDLTYAVTLTAGTSYFATITPYNANGDATGCTEASFTSASAPVCPVVTATPDAACGNFDSNISWVAIAGADSYTVTVGTSTGGSDIADNVDIGTALSYDFASMAGTDYYYTVNAVNTAGTSTGCAEGTFTSFATGCVCDSVPSSNDGMGITNLQVGTTDFPSGGDITYEDFTGTPVDLGQGIVSNVQIVFATGYTYGTNIWIDFNDDLTFDSATELVFSGVSAAPNPSTLDASFTMPATANLGAHLMRIGTADSGQATPNPCYNGSYGVTMDLDVNIITVSCTPPTATAALVPDCANAQFFVDIDITDLGSGSPSVNDGFTNTPVTTTGVFTAGPYVDGTSVSLIVENGTEATCDLSLGGFTNLCPPSNDACVDAIFIASFNNDDMQDASSATNNDGFISVTGCGSANDGVWYTFEVADAGMIDIDVTDVAGWDPEITVLSGACDAFSCVTNADSAGGSGSESASFAALASTQYWVNVAYYSGFSDNSEGPFTINVSTPDTASLATSLDVDDFNTKSLFTYYPNPVNNTLTLNAQQAITNVAVFNMLGQEVIRTAPNAVSNEVNMSNLQSGAYFVQVTIGQRVETVRIIKN